MAATSPSPRPLLLQELTRCRARLSRLADHDAALRRALEQAELRLLIAETPLAARDRSQAAARLEALRSELTDLEDRLGELERMWASAGEPHGV